MSKQPDTSNLSHSSPSPQSSSLLLVGLAVVAAAYFGFVRPAQEHMQSLERQCGKLVVAVKKLQNKDDTARHGLRLMSLLESQSEKLATAEQAVRRFTDLRQRLVEEADGMAVAMEALEKLEAVQSDVARYSNALTHTAATMSEMADATAAITASITTSGETARQANGSLAKLSEQQIGLAGGIAQLTEQLSSLESGVVSRKQKLPQAEEVLLQIDQLCGQLAGEVQNLSAAQTQLGALVELKENVLEQSADVSAATAALDQVWDLKDGLLQATATINKARKLTVDMMLLEPVLDRVAKSLQPMAEATRLSRRAEAKAPRTAVTKSAVTKSSATEVETASPWSSAINVFVAFLGNVR